MIQYPDSAKYQADDRAKDEASDEPEVESPEEQGKSLHEIKWREREEIKDGYIGGIHAMYHGIKIPSPDCIHKINDAKRDEENNEHSKQDPAPARVFYINTLSLVKSNHDEENHEAENDDPK